MARPPLILVSPSIEKRGVEFHDLSVSLSVKDNDIRRQMPGALSHQHMDQADEIVHEAPLTPGSMLARITGKQILGINSRHHQGVLQPAEPLAAVARTHDGIVEAMEWCPEAARRMPFLLSAQFHPERLVRKCAGHRAIFSRFVEICRPKRIP